jgi:hypothetical protein
LKRIFAIVLLSIHLFNLGGYNLLFQYYINQSDAQMVKQIFDNKVDEHKFLEIKIPVHMPTIQDWSEYEVITGQIQLKDAYYNYVKLKMTRDTMYMICLPNTAKTRLVKENVIAAKMINDVPVSKKGQDPLAKRISNTLNEYNIQAFQYHYVRFGKLIKQNTTDVFYQLNRPYIFSPGKPPNVIA